MKTNSKQDASGGRLGRLVLDLVASARDQKRRVRERLRALRGDEIRTPSRGPIQKNGMRCIRWHYWQAATAKHREITGRISYLQSLIQNAEAIRPATINPNETNQ